MVEDALAHSQRGSYYSTNEDEEAVAALEAVAFFLDCARSSDPMWRWAIVALHSAAQGMMVAALKGTDGVGVLRDGDVKKKHTAWEKARKASAAGDAAAADAAQLEALFGASKLAEFHVLYKRVKEDDWMGQYATSRRFQPRATDDNCLTCLNGLRNEFIHFKPMQRSFLVTGFPAITDAGLYLIEFLLQDSGNIVWSGDPSSELDQRSTVALDRARSVLANISTAYAGLPLPAWPLCGCPPQP